MRKTKPPIEPCRHWVLSISGNCEECRAFFSVFSATEDAQAARDAHNARVIANMQANLPGLGEEDAQ